MNLINKCRICRQKQKNSTEHQDPEMSGVLVKFHGGEIDKPCVLPAATANTVEMM